MKRLRISDDLELPVDVVTQKLAFIGRTGSGKTYAATKLAELMLDAGAQIVVLDQVGAWHGLRVGENAYQIRVFGGLHGDIRLEPTGGALMANLIVDRGMSAVLDVSQMISAEQCRFATDFADRFFQRKKASPSAVHVFLEECQEVVPQNHQRGEERMVHVFQRMQKLGRGFGIGVSLISQRPQEINKKALNQTECLFAFQMTGPQERKAIADWVHDKGLDIDVQAILPKLAVGEAHVWSPQWLDVSKTVRIAKKRTADVSATPKVGAKAAAVRDLSPIDLEDLRQQLAATIDRAKAEDPKALQAEVAKLKRELAAKPAPTAAAPPKVVEVPVLKAEQVERLEAAMAAATKAVDRLVETAAAIRSAIHPAVTDAIVLAGRQQFATNGTQHPRPPARAQLPSPRVGPGTKEPVRPAPATRPVGMNATGIQTVDLGKCERAILAVLAQHPDGCRSGKLALLAGYSWSGGFRNSLSTLRTAGLIEGGNGDAMRPTEAGLLAAAGAEPLPTGEDLVQHWLRHPSFGACERKIIEALLANADGLVADALAAEAGYEWSGGFRNSLSTLRTAGVLVGRNSETMRLCDELLAAAGGSP